MKKLNNLLICTLLICANLAYGQDPNVGIKKPTDIIVYKYDSEVFKEISDIYNDSLQFRCKCSDMNLARLSFFDSTDYIRVRISHLSGVIYKTDGSSSSNDVTQFGLKLDDSEIVFLVSNRYIDLVKSIGSLKFLYQTDIWDLMDKKKNDCLYKECSIRLFRIDIDSYWDSSIVARPAIFYYRD